MTPLPTIVHPPQTQISKAARERQPPGIALPQPPLIADQQQHSSRRHLRAQQRNRDCPAGGFIFGDIFAVPFESTLSRPLSYHHQLGFGWNHQIRDRHRRLMPFFAFHDYRMAGVGVFVFDFFGFCLHHFQPFGL